MYRFPVEELRVPLPCSGAEAEGRQGDVQPFAQVNGRIVGSLLGGLGPQVQGVAGAAALEAVEHVLVEVGREAVAGAGGRAVQRAGTALLRRRARCGSWQPSSCKTAAMVTSGSTAAKSMAGSRSDSGLTLLSLVLGLA